MKAKILAPLLIIEFLLLYLGSTFGNWAMCMAGGLLLIAMALSTVLSK